MYVLKSLPSVCSSYDSPFSLGTGGQAIHRSEAFLVGQPLVDLGAAMPQACISELVVAPSALSVCDTSLQGEPRLGGCVCIPLPKRCEPVKRDEAISKRKFSRTQTPYRDRLNGSVLDMMLFLDMKCQERQSSHSDIESEIRSAELVAGLRSSRGQENTSPMSAQGLDVLLRFMPQLVKSRMLAEVPLDEALAEHRDISVLFITGALQAGFPLRCISPHV